ncbi:MAG: helicase-related protein, partial [Vicinamibacteraceae bacterium]
VLMTPGLSDRRLERRWLSVLATLAIRAQRAERKRAALVRLVRRIAEPVVVFTEFRDTLAMLVQSLRQVASIAVLHGAQEAEERRDALARFSDGRARILVATDAACEGLNLHARCRLVVVYELPWNPNRLEQRIGRVDRLGQAKRVHVIELVLAGSREDTVLTRLSARLWRIAAALDPAGGPPAMDRTGEMSHDVAMRALEAAMVVGDQSDIEGAGHLLGQVGRTRGEFLSRLALDEQSRQACVELRRLRQLGALWGGRTPHAGQISSVIAHMQRRGPWIAVLDTPRRRKHRRKTLAPMPMSGTTLVTLFVTELQDASGRPVISIPTTLAGACPPLHGVAARRAPKARALVAELVERLAASPHARKRVAGETDSAIAAACHADRRLLARLRQREHRIQGERERLARLHAPDLFGRLSSHPSRPLRGSTDAAAITPEPRYITRVSLQLALLVDGVD